MLTLLDNYKIVPANEGMAAYAHTLVEAASQLQDAAEIALAGATLDEGIEASEDLYTICAIFPDLLVQRSQVNPPSSDMPPKLATDNIIVDGLCEVGIDLCSFIMEDEAKIANLRLPETAPELAAVLMAGGKTLDQDLSARASMFAISGLLPALETIHGATSKAVQTLLFHNF